MENPSWKSLTTAVILTMLLLPALAAVVYGDDSVFVQEGKQLYEKHCSRCHGDVNDSAKAGRSMNRLRSALKSLAQHKTVSKLTDEEILLIAMALKEE